MLRVQQIMTPGDREKEKQQRHNVDLLFLIEINIARLCESYACLIKSLHIRILRGHIRVITLCGVQQGSSWEDLPKEVFFSWRKVALDVSY
jgi:hypothetical protein